MCRIAAVCAAMAGLTLVANASVIGFENYTFTGSEAIETGRIVRNGVASAWGTAKPFPGPFGGSFEFTTFTFNSGSTGELQISMTDISSSEFISLYGATFDPANIGTNYLGDAGLSGQFQVFQVDGTPNTNYTVVVNEASAGLQSGDLVNVCVEGFSSASNPAPTPACSNLNQSLINPVPEPATSGSLLFALPILLLAGRRLRLARSRG